MNNLEQQTWAACHTFVYAPEQRATCLLITENSTQTDVLSLSQVKEKNYNNDELRKAKRYILRRIGLL